MASYSVKIDIASSMFPEVGTPIYPNTVKDAKPSKDIKEDYVDLVQGTDMARGSMDRAMRDSVIDEATPQCLKMHFDYEKDTSKTYKFLGMDVDEDYNAIIELGTGHIIVGSMFDRDVVLNNVKNYRSYGFSDSDKELCVNIVNSLNQEDVRKISTAIKTGIAYDVIRKASNSYGSVDASMLTGLVNILNKDGGNISNLEFKSILLNLVHAKTQEQLATKSSGSSKDMAAIVLSALMLYWSDLADEYSAIYASLACLDLWSDVNKKMTSGEHFNSLMSKCVTITDNATGLDDGGIISFAGISKNGATTDDNITRKSSADAMRALSSTLKGGSQNIDPIDLLVGFADLDGIDDVYSLSREELQALSILDSLQYIDEDAILCKESYDMNNPDERGLFVKSAIRSYERNFKEFKPAENYDVTEALAEMVERGDISTNPNIVIPKEDATEGSVEDTVTASKEDLNVQVNKKNFLRIMKLVNKSTSQILKGF